MQRRACSPSGARRWQLLVLAVASVVAVWLPTTLVLAGDASAGDAVASWSFAGALSKGQSVEHETWLTGGPVTGILGRRGGNAEVRLRVYAPGGAKVFDRRGSSNLAFSTSAPAGRHRWLVTAYGPMDFLLTVSTSDSPSMGTTPVAATDAASTTSGVTTASLASPQDGGPPVFYVDGVAGSDSGDGRSPQRAWRTLARASSAALSAGSSVLLRGGQVFPGTLSFDGTDGAVHGAPFVVGSYGGGKAIISSGPARGISVHNRAVIIRDLHVVGDFSGSADGIVLYNDLPGDVLLGGVTVAGVEVSGYRGWGIAMGSGSGRSGYRDVVFEGVDLHGNGLGGLLTYAGRPNVHERVSVLRSRAHDNPGYTGASGHTGNGFVLGGVSGGEVAYSSAYRNGGANDVDAEGPAGIWTYHSDRVVIQFNESYDNRTGSRADGDGFDLDIGTTNSVVQYNYSHGNDGAGFLLWQEGPVPSGSNIVRYNISENDGRRNGYGGITVGGDSPNTVVVHNTIYTAGAATSGAPAVALFDGPAGYRFQNNLFMVAAGLPVVAAEPESRTPAVTFHGNAYFAAGGAFAVQWAGSTFFSLESWRTGTGQERAHGDDVGLFMDPQVLAPGGGGTLGDPAALPSSTSYLPTAASPLIGAALPLTPAERGAQDFRGSLLPVGGAADVGALQGG